MDEKLTAEFRLSWKKFIIKTTPKFTFHNKQQKKINNEKYIIQVQFLMYNTILRSQTLKS